MVWRLRTPWRSAIGPVVVVETPTVDRIIDASRIKADHKMAYADAFAAATAIACRAVLWTGDPELLVDDSPWRWEDLRQS